MISHELTKATMSTARASFAGLRSISHTSIARATRGRFASHGGVILPRAPARSDSVGVRPAYARTISQRSFPGPISGRLPANLSETRQQDHGCLCPAVPVTGQNGNVRCTCTRSVPGLIPFGPYPDPGRPPPHPAPGRTGSSRGPLGVLGAGVRAGVRA